MTGSSRRTASLCAFALGLVSALAATGCGWGYVTYFEPRGGARPVLHADPYMRPPPPAGAELAPGELAIGCTNIRKFMLLPFPWLRRGFRPDEVEIELSFLSEPKVALLDVGAVALSLDGRELRPSRVAYRGERPAPVYFETVVLRTLDRHTLEEPRLVTFTFRTELGGADAMQLRLGELRVDGTRTELPPITFSREGQFVSYRLPGKHSSPAARDAGLAADL